MFNNSIIRDQTEYLFTSQFCDRCRKDGVFKVHLAVDNIEFVILIIPIWNACRNTETWRVQGSLGCKTTKDVEEDLDVTLWLM
jgi:hypothetical protein